MIRMTDRATERVEAYVDRVRRALAAHPDVDADEVVRDIRAHVEEALRDHAGPVGEDDVAAVLDRLGSPDHWTPFEQAPGWRGFLDRIRRGPDDWRLAWLCFALTLLALATMPMGVGFLWILPAFVLARGAVAIADERGEPPGAQRWLVYPALVGVYILLGAVLVAAPIAVWGEVFSPGGIVEHLSRTNASRYPAAGTSEYFVWSVGWTLAALGAWWCALGGAAAARPAWVRSLFHPFAAGFRRGLTWIPVLAGVAAAVAGAAVLALA